MALILIDGLNMTIDRSVINISIPGELGVSLLGDELDIAVPAEDIDLSLLEEGVGLSVYSDEINLTKTIDDIDISIEGCTKVVPAGDLMIKTAAENVGGHRIVTVDHVGDVLHADKDLILDGKKAIGMTTQAALAGNQVVIAISGDEIVEPSWNWNTSLPIYLGDDGVITQTAPTEGFVLIVGVVLSPTSVRIRVEMPIFL